mgnify:CR=1 FL=1
MNSNQRQMDSVEVTKNPATRRGDRLCFRNLNNYFTFSYKMIFWILYIQTNHC